MGVSTDAILFYGYVWDEETSAPWTIGKDGDGEYSDEDDEDWEKRYARLNGVATDYASRRQIVEECPVKVDTHCHSDAPMPFVCIKSSYICNSRGDMTRLNPEQFEVEEEWDDQLKKFCKLMGIPIPAEGPGWYMVSYWG
jgi:hypothetical protein